MHTSQRLLSRLKHKDVHRMTCSMSITPNAGPTPETPNPEPASFTHLRAEG